MNIVGVEVPHAVVPVRPGRNMTTIVEVAARNHLLKLQGHHSAQEFAERLKDAIAKGRDDRPARLGGDDRRRGRVTAAPSKHIVVITGMSGSGKSTAIRALEDAGLLLHRQPARAAACPR